MIKFPWWHCDRSFFLKIKNLWEHSSVSKLSEKSAKKDYPRSDAGGKLFDAPFTCPAACVWYPIGSACCSEARISRTRFYCFRTVIIHFLTFYCQNLIIFIQILGVIWGSFWHHFGTVLAQFWHNFGTIFGPSGDHFGIYFCAWKRYSCFFNFWRMSAARCMVLMVLDISWESQNEVLASSSATFVYNCVNEPLCGGQVTPSWPFLGPPGCSQGCFR